MDWKIADNQGVTPLEHSAVANHAEGVAMFTAANILWRRGFDVEKVFSGGDAGPEMTLEDIEEEVLTLTASGNTAITDLQARGGWQGSRVRENRLRV